LAGTQFEEFLVRISRGMIAGGVVPGLEQFVPSNACEERPLSTTPESILGSLMLKRWDVLVACADMGNRNSLIRMLEGMSVGVYSCCTLSQAAEVLSSRKIELVFCDENLSDGSFRDLLRRSRLWIGTPHFVVIVQFAECKECMETLQVGDFEVMSTPLYPTDIELAVIRAMRNGNPESLFRVSA
jgi:hypothetical protein